MAEKVAKSAKKFFIFLLFNYGIISYTEVVIVKKDTKFDNERQLLLLKKYYQVDEENKIITINVHYDKASDFLNTSIGNNNNPIIRDEALENVNSIIQSIPVVYKVRINFDIKDYENYNPKNIIQSFNDTLELNQYTSRRLRQRKNLIAATLILVGVILLCFMVIGKNKIWFGEGIKAEVIAETINIAAWVFVWEAVSMLFLEKSEQKIFALRIRTRVSEISMLETDRNNILACETAEAIFGKWDNESKLKRYSKMATLISSMILIFTSFYTLYSLITGIITNTFSGFFLIVVIVVSIISILAYFFAGIAGLRNYIGKINGISKFMGIYVAILILNYVITIIGQITNSNLSIIFSTIGSVVINFLYISGYIIDKYYKR